MSAFPDGPAPDPLNAPIPPTDWSDIVRAAAHQWAAEQHPALAGLALTITDAMASAATQYGAVPTMSGLALACGMGVRQADVSSVLQQSPNARARAANELAVWVGW